MVEVVTVVESQSEVAVHTPARTIRVLYLFPGMADGSAMIFAKKQVAAVRDCGVVSEIFALESRTDLSCLRQEWKRLQQHIASFRPDLVHAQYGTMTAFLGSVTTRVPLVITFRGSDLNPAPSDPWARSVVRRWLSQYAARKAGGIPARTLKDQLSPLKNEQVWRFSLYYFFVFGAFVALFLTLVEPTIPG